MASIKTSIKQKVRNNATFKLTEQYTLMVQPLIAMKNFLNVKWQSRKKEKGQLYEQSSTNSETGFMFLKDWESVHNFPVPY